MPPKKKAQKMALSDFFETTGGSNWADEMEALPTAPAKREDTGPRRGEPGYLDSMPDRSARFGGGPPPRDDVPIPDVPPFTAFVGNLTFETEEDELRAFFDDLNPVSVRLVKDATGKGKGFGYVEFGSKDSLKAGLDRTGANLAGRSIRVNVADAPASRPGREFLPSQADESNQWRRSTPLPAREVPAPRRNFSGASNDGGAERDWSAARGAKFTPSRESSGYGRPRDAREPREPREMHHEPTAADEADQWRSSRPMVTPAVPAARTGGREAPPHRPAGPAETESTWSRGTRVSSGPAEPAGRQRLNLKPRSAAPDSPESSPAAKSSSASPFGAARPIDTASREREAEQHLEERRKATAEAAAAKKEREAKEKEAREAREAAQREQQQQRRPVRVHPSRLPPKEVAQADEDGFETVGAGARRQQEGAAAAAAPAAAKPAAAKAGFSFAAAAGVLDTDADTDAVADKLAKTEV